MSMLVKELLALGQTQLEQCGIPNAENDSKILYCELMKVPRSRLFMEYQIVLSEEPCDKYFALLDRRCAGEPLQYIVGTQAFIGLDFVVDENVLIPRPETEILVENALSILKEKKNPEVLDLCCGSGAIGLSVAKLEPKAKVTLTDASEGAIGVAKKNAANLGVTVSFEQGDLFAPLKKRFRQKKFDMILSNPPYIPSDVIPTLQTEVKDHEPMMALDGGQDGLDFYRRIALAAPEFLKKEGILLMEIGAEQRESITNILEVNGGWEDIRCIKDLAGLDRIIFAVKKA